MQELLENHAPIRLYKSKLLENLILVFTFEEMYTSKHILCFIVIWICISQITSHCVCEDGHSDICAGCAGRRIEDDRHYQHYGSSADFEHPTNADNCWCNQINADSNAGGFASALGPKHKKLKCDCSGASYAQRNSPYNMVDNLTPAEISGYNSALKHDRLQQKVRWSQPYMLAHKSLDTYQDNLQFSQLSNGKLIKHDLQTYPLRQHGYDRIGMYDDDHHSQNVYFKKNNLSARSSYLKRKCALCRKSHNHKCSMRN